MKLSRRCIRLGRERERPEYNGFLLVADDCSFFSTENYC